jgi:alpha-tubulin suppressor-like RCC1 family protein
MRALKTDGTLWAAGINSSGQLGNNTTDNANSPVQSGTDTDWATVGEGVVGIATKTNGTIWTWGRNASGAAGQGDVENISSPTQLGSDTTWSKGNSSNVNNDVMSLFFTKG